MAENIDQETKTKEDVHGILWSIRQLIREIFNVHDEVDKPGTAESIKKDIVFRGFNIWILILSILICSIGLNLNSNAVIIGAMLISPLMGPITGIGFAVGTFDRDLLIKAIKNLSIAVIISVLASFIFFSFAPISFDHSELDARISPGIMDLFVALFGGFAGILAGTRGSKTNVIPGVAIATALMPPLCTAGYGLAEGDMNYFLGAAYLFFINSVFISVSALLVVRYLRFPIASYVNPKIQRRTKTLIMLFVIIVAVPSVFIYSKALRESRFKTEAKNFVDQCVNDKSHTVIDPILEYSDSTKRITLFVYGDEYTNKQKDSLAILMQNFRLNNTELKINNMGSFDAYQRLASQKDEIIGEKQILSDQLRFDLHTQNERNTALNTKITSVITSCKTLDVVKKEANVLFPDLKQLDYAIKPLDDSLKSIAVMVFVDWDATMSRSTKSTQHDKLSDWLKLKFTESDSIRVFEVD